MPAKIKVILCEGCGMRTRRRTWLWFQTHAGCGGQLSTARHAEGSTAWRRGARETPAGVWSTRAHSPCVRVRVRVRVSGLVMLAHSWCTLCRPKSYRPCLLAARLGAKFCLITSVMKSYKKIYEWRIQRHTNLVCAPCTIYLPGQYAQPRCMAV
jgi:hypothetical protein